MIYNNNVNKGGTIMDIYQAKQIRFMYQSGQITRDEAREYLEPFIKEFNAKSIEIAAKYNQKPKLFSFASFIR